MKNKKRILVVENCDLVRIGLRSLLENYSLGHLVAETKQIRDLLYLVKQYQPHIIMIDQLLINDHSIAYFSSLKKYSTQSKVLVLAEQDSLFMQLKMLQAGAVGVISKYSSCKLLLSAITAIHSGKFWLGRSSFSAKQVQSKSYQSLTLPYANEIAACSRLSKAESLVASLACQGLSAKKIGSQLSITEKTVRNHLSVIYRKVGVRKQIELCIKAPLYSL